MRIDSALPERFRRRGSDAKKDRATGNPLNSSLLRQQIEIAACIRPIYTCENCDIFCTEASISTQGTTLCRSLCAHCSQCFKYSIFAEQITTPSRQAM